MFKIGDYVQTKVAIELVGINDLLFQWGGRVAEITNDLINVEFDAKSLEQLPLEFIIECEDSGFDWISYNFFKSEIEKCKRRDSNKKREAAFEKIMEKLLEIEEEKSVATKLQMEKWNEAFQKSKYHENLSEFQKENASFIIHTFTDFMIDYQWVESPDDWTTDDIEAVCLEWAPQKISSEIELFENYGDVLIEFFKFLEDNGFMKNTGSFQKCVEKIKGKIAPASQNSSTWGPAKSMMMKAISEGLDLNDQSAVNAYLKKEEENGFSNFDPFGREESYFERQEPVRKSLMDKIGRNQKVSVKYTDGQLVEDVKFKKVEKDIAGGKCTIVKF